MSGIYDVTIAAGASAYVGATGSYVKVLTAPQGVVQVKLDGGEGYSLLAGQGFRLPDDAAWFRDVQVTNKAAAAQTVTLFIGDSRFEDSRITGNVNVIDQGVDKTSAGSQFLQSAGAAAAGALGSCVYVGAPVGSLRAILKGLSAQSATAGQMTLYSATNVAGSTLAPASIVASKLLGGANATSIRMGGSSGLAAAQPGAGEFAGLQGIANVYVPANQNTPILITTPIVIPNGTRLLILAGAALNRDVSLVIDAEESAA